MSFEDTFRRRDRESTASVYSRGKGTCEKGRRRPTAFWSGRSARRHPLLEELELRQLLALTIVPTFASNITSDPQAATIEATINRTIAAYEAVITDNVTVDITFQEGGGLGGSSGGLQYPEKYTDYRAALVSHATTANDNTAIASLPVQTNDPVNNNANIFVRSPLARALGFSAPNAGGAAGDGTITLNTAICNLDRTSAQDSTKFDLQAVTAHEIDEILGFGSSLDAANNGSPAPTGNILPDDLFRYDQTGARSYTTSATAQAYFSINGGTTDLARFNQTHNTTNSGDYGDWYSFFGGQTPQVQDAFGTRGATANLGVELTRLDVLGYSLSPLRAPVITAPGDQMAAEGASQAINLGSFTDSNVAPWGVSVSWGDSSPNTSFFLNNSGPLGSQPHTYAEEGNYTITVSVTNFTSQTQTETFHVSVSDPEVHATGGQTITPVEGASSGPVLLATFTDPGGPEPTGNYSADINWGDGTPTQVGAGSITFNGTNFEVRGSHTYAEERSAANPYIIFITIHHETSPEQIVTSAANVSDPKVLQASATPVTAVEAASFSGVTLATFTDPGGAEPNPGDPTGGIASHYKIVSINWGDGTPLDTSTGALSFSGTPGSATSPFTVSGSHTYGEEGNYTISVLVDHEGVQTTLTDTASVSDPKVMATGVPVFATACTLLSGVTVATFTDPGGAEPNPSDPMDGIPSHYKVTSINWGDSTPLDTSSGAISFSGAPGSKTDSFTVTGSHTYETEGSFTITVVINHEGQTTTVTTTAIVKDKLGLLLLDPTGDPSLMVSGNGNVTVNGDCGAVVVDSNAPTYAATVTGNGTVTAGDFDVTGGVLTSGNAVAPSPVDHEAPTPDPLGLGLPSPLPPAPVGNTATLLHPGTYVGGLHLSGKTAVTLAPGVYVMEGGGFSVTGQASVTGSGVLIVNIPGGDGDTISVTGKGAVSLSAPTSGPYQGVAVVQVAASPVSFSGQANVSIVGVFYTPNAPVSLTGNAAVTINPSPGTATLPPIFAAMIAFDLKVTGNGDLTINPDDPPSGAMAAAAQLAGGPAGGQPAAIDALMSGGGLTGPGTLSDQDALNDIAMSFAGTTDLFGGATFGPKKPH